MMNLRNKYWRNLEFVVVEPVREEGKKNQLDVIGEVSKDDGAVVVNTGEGSEATTVVADDVEDGEWSTYPQESHVASSNKTNELKFGQVSILSKSRFSVLEEAEHDDESVEHNVQDLGDTYLEKVKGNVEETGDRDKTIQTFIKPISDIDKSLDNLNDANQMGKPVASRQTLHSTTKNNQKNSDPSTQKAKDGNPSVSTKRITRQHH